MGCSVFPRNLWLIVLSGGASAGAIYFIYWIFTEAVGASGVLFFFIPLTAAMVICFFYFLFCGWWSCDKADPAEKMTLL